MAARLNFEEGKFSLKFHGKYENDVKTFFLPSFPLVNVHVLQKTSSRGRSEPFHLLHTYLQLH